jgi:hypothetical protein
MEWLIVAAVVLAIFWVAAKSLIGAARKQQEANADTVLDGWFDGRPQVFVEQGPTTMSEERILEGANVRAYRLVSSERLKYPKQAYQKMLFEKSGS